MNQFNDMPPEVKKIKELDENVMKLMDENKFSEASDVCNELLENLSNLPESQKEPMKDFFEELQSDVRDRYVLCKQKSEDYDSAIELGLKFLELKETYGIHSRLGICYFKKGKYYKARDHFNKAKNISPDFQDKIVENYIKQTAEMIADIES